LACYRLEKEHLVPFYCLESSAQSGHINTSNRNTATIQSSIRNGFGLIGRPRASNFLSEAVSARILARAPVFKGAEIFMHISLMKNSHPESSVKGHTFMPQLDEEPPSRKLCKAHAFMPQLDENPSRKFCNRVRLHAAA
jgi:hypothetical protein